MAVVTSRSLNSLCRMPRRIASGWKQQSKQGALSPFLSFSIWGGPREYGTDQQVPWGVSVLEGTLILSDWTILRNTFSLSLLLFLTILNDFATNEGSGLYIVRVQLYITVYINNAIKATKCSYLISSFPSGTFCSPSSWVIYASVSSLFFGSCSSSI